MNNCQDQLSEAQQKICETRQYIEALQTTILRRIGDDVAIPISDDCYKVLTNVYSHLDEIYKTLT